MKDLGEAEPPRRPIVLGTGPPFFEVAINGVGHFILIEDLGPLAVGLECDLHPGMCMQILIWRNAREQCDRHRRSFSLGDKGKL
jgi:hypothetical protein